MRTSTVLRPLERSHQVRSWLSACLNAVDLATSEQICHFSHFLGDPADGNNSDTRAAADVQSTNRHGRVRIRILCHIDNNIAAAGAVDREFVYIAMKSDDVDADGCRWLWASADGCGRLRTAGGGGGWLRTAAEPPHPPAPANICYVDGLIATIWSTR